jgi:hypothetical protein
VIAVEREYTADTARCAAALLVLLAHRAVEDDVRAGDGAQLPATAPPPAAAREG